MSPFWEIKVLLVETNPTAIRLVEKIMETSPVFYFMRRIDNVHDLNFELKYNKPDLIISGRTMNGFDGIQVLDMVHMYSSDIPVLILAPDFNLNSNADYVNHGAYDIIYHSELKRLPNEVAYICEQKGQQRQLASGN